MKTRFLVAILLMAFTGTPGHASQQYVFEKADILTRPKLWDPDIPDVEHAGLYLNNNSVYRFTKEQAIANALPESSFSGGYHSVIHSTPDHVYDDVTAQTNTGVQIVSFQGFLSTKASEYRGAWESDKLTTERRHNAILAAGRQLGTEYTFWSKWKGPDYLRCDGLIRYVYSQTDVNAPFTEEPGGWRKNYPRHLRAQLTLASGRAPICASAVTTPDGSSFSIATGSVKDDANGSGIDRVEFYYGDPTTAGTMIGTDDHDSNPDAGVGGSSAYSVSSIFDPTLYVYTKIYDQAGNWSICTASGQSIGTSNLTQTVPIFIEDTVSPFLTNPTIALNAVGTSATVSWSSSDDKTASGDILFAYALDVPFDQWDTPIVTVEGQVPVSSGKHEISVNLTGLADGMHTFYLIGIDEEGNICSQQATFQLDTTPPAAPSLTQRDVRGGDGRAMVAWTAPEENADGSTPLSDLAGYRIYYAIGADPRAGWPVELAASVESKELTGLANDMPHTVCVTAVDTVGNESACSDTVSVTPAGGDVNGQPGNIRWVHKTGGPSGSFTKISDALAGAPNGTTIMVGPDVYEETALLVGAAGDDAAISGWYPRDIWLMSERGPAETKILATQISVGDLCRVVGFTMMHPDGEALRISFDEGVLVANNIFLGSQTAVFSGGSYTAGLHDPENEDLRRNRIYNNVFAGNVIGVGLWSSYAVTDIQNNIFEKAGGGKAIDYDVVCGNAFVQHNIMHDYGGDPNAKSRCAVVAYNTSCDPGFVGLNGANLLGSDFHLQGTLRCAIDKGALGLTYQDMDQEIEWTDCVAAAGNSRRADYGAYGGPFAYVDKNVNRVPDCSEAAGNSVAIAVMMNSVNQPVTLTARSGNATALTYNVTAPTAHGELAGAAPELSYTPTAQYAGLDEASFTVSDGLRESEPAEVSIRVKDSNTAPVVAGQSLATPSQISAAIVLQGSDADDDPLDYSIIAGPSSGSVVCAHPPDCLYLPDEATHGEVSFTYKAGDGFAESDPATVTILVNTEPTISFTSPSATEAPTKEAWHKIIWRVDDEDSAATASLYYDTDGAGFDGTLIVADLPEVVNSEDLGYRQSSYLWNISGLGEGTYFVYAIVRDEWTSTSAYAPGPLVIDRTPPVVTVSPPAGWYHSAPEVSFQKDESDTVHCRTDGYTPSIYSPVCSSPVVVDHSPFDLKWVAVDVAGNQSVDQARYTIDATPPVVTVSPLGGAYNTDQSVSISADNEAPTTIYVTTDGGLPTLLSPTYAGPIAVNESLTLRWLAIDPAGNRTEGSATYTIDRIPPEVSASPPAGTYRQEQMIELRLVDPNEVAVIHYTIGGQTPPSKSSPVYAGPIATSANSILVVKWLAIDAAGNEKLGEAEYVFDSIAPEVWISALQNPMKQALEFVVLGNREYGARVLLEADQALEIGPMVLPSEGSWSCTVRNPPLGPITFTVTAKDDADNTASASATTIIYNQPPSIISSYPQGAAIDLSADGSTIFVVTVTDPDDAVLSLTWTLDGQVIGSGSSLDFSPDAQLADGMPRALTLTASDGFLSAERTWEVTVRRVGLVDDDNNDACTYTGSWAVLSSASGYLGTGYHRSSGTDAGSATCIVPLDSAGTYKVYARWPAASTHDPHAVYRVTLLDGKIDDILVDQTGNGGQWNLLGTYAFGTTASVRLISTSGDMAVADAIRLVATADPPDIVLDDAEGTAVGIWDSVTGGFRGTYRATTGAEGINSFTWTPGAVTPGTWDLLARWRGVTGGTQDAKYVLSFDGMRTSQVTVDQTVLGGRWNLLGTYSFESTDTPSVSITDNASGIVVADGVKLAYRDAGSVTIVDNDSDGDLVPTADGVPDRFGWSGAWTASNGVAGFVGTSYRRIDAGSVASNCAKWLLYIPESGNYELFARWTEATDRSSSARYEFRQKGSTNVSVTAVDQRDSGGQWAYLGRFACEKDDDPLQAPAEHETYVQVCQSTDGVVVADAVLFARTDEDLPLIVDNVTGEDLRATFDKSTGWGQLPDPLLPGHWGSDYFQTVGADKWATWTAELSTPGNYDIFARWTADANRTATASYLIGGAGGPVVVKDQRSNGGAWVSLGRYYRPEGSTSVKLTSQGDGVTVADAVRFDYTTLPLSFVIDNIEDAEPPHACSAVGNWPSFTTPVDAWGGEYQTHDTGGGGTFRWTPTLPLRGYYAVYARWPTANSLFSTAAPFRIVHGSNQVQETRNMDQRNNGAKWNYLGTYLFEAGDAGFVELSGAADGKVLADAVKFIAEGN